MLLMFDGHCVIIKIADEKGVFQMDGHLRNMASVYIMSENKMLMLYRIGSRVVAPSWCGIGGHFEKDELNDAERAMFRELKEEVNLRENDLENIKLRYIALRNKNGEIRINYYFFADLREGVSVQTYCSEGKLQWVDFEKVTEKKMPYTAEYVLKHYMEKGRYTDCLYCAAAKKETVVFTELENF